MRTAAVGPPSLGWSSDDTDTAVYIEEEARLRDLSQIIRLYLVAAARQRVVAQKISSSHSSSRYHAGNSPNHLSELLARKGYEVVDLRQNSRSPGIDLFPR